MRRQDESILCGRLFADLKQPWRRWLSIPMPMSDACCANLARLRKRAGKVRDLDVLIGYVAGLKISGEEDCRVQLLEYLGSEHDRRSQQLRSVAVKHGESLCGRLKRTSVHLEALAKDSAVGNSAPGHAMLSEVATCSENWQRPFV